MISATLPIRPGETQGSVPRRTIPFDYAFRYELAGTPRNVLDATVTVSVEAAFVAVSIGYGVIPKVSPIKFPAPPTGFITAMPGSLREVFPGIDLLAQAVGESPKLGRGGIGPQTASALTNGIKLNPDLAERALLSGADTPLDPGILKSLFQVVAPPPDQIQFLYAIFDEGTGRAFQDEPMLNIAGLGIANGDRPFRYFAKPIVFAPRSTIRMQVTEVSDFQGELHVSMQGYKVLGGAGAPTGRLRRPTRRRRVR